VIVGAVGFLMESYYSALEMANVNFISRFHQRLSESAYFAPSLNAYLLYFFFLVSLGGARLSPLGTSATNSLLYQPRKIDDECETVGGMRIGRGNRSTQRKPAPVPFCSPQIPRDLTWLEPGPPWWEAGD
jgi:hypothetical protein